MSDFDRPASTLYDEQAKPRSSGSRFGERLARTFGGFDRTREELPAWEEGDLEYGVGAETEAWEVPGAPFAIIAHGYDPVAVDRRIAELELELEQLRGRIPGTDAVTAEIERIGEQTSAILIAAHEQAQEIRRDAQQQADRCLADAAANAVTMTAEAKRRLSDLDTETDSVWQERGRLLEDARNLATALLSLVQNAAERFPAEGDKGGTTLPPPGGEQQ
jgi:hypothetical protein